LRAKILSAITINGSSTVRYIIAGFCASIADLVVAAQLASGGTAERKTNVTAVLSRGRTLTPP
jgi:ribose/xylose/arabinose/galactoside ABC-type transport system permease subunit